MSKKLFPFALAVVFGAMLWLCACGADAPLTSADPDSGNAPAAVQTSVSSLEETEPSMSDPQSAGNSKQLLIYTSIYPMYDFTKKVAGDKAEIVNLVPSGSEPHDWEPSSQDMAALSKADLLVVNGAGMEPWLEAVTAALGADAPVILMTSDKIELIQEDEEDNHEGSGAHGGPDPHVWLDPKNARVQMEAIAEALASIDPPNADSYRSHYTQYAAQLDELDQSIAVALAGLPKNDIVAAHQAYGYLCRAYGLDQVALEGLMADAEPSPARMAELIRYCQDNDVTTIFTEPLSSEKPARTLADELNVRLAVLDPFEGLSQEDIDAGEDYFSVMERNRDALVQALSS